MPSLRDDEIRRLLKLLRGKTQDAEKLAFIEDELRGDFGSEFLREPEILSYFSDESISILEAGTVWKLKIISYTQMRMTQRGIKQREILSLFERFLKVCQAEAHVIAVGAYTVFGKADARGSVLTLRIDVDKIRGTENEAHTVTVFIGRGDGTQTTRVNLLS